jgi:hypothetical protein
MNSVAELVTNVGSGFSNEHFPHAFKKKLGLIFRIIMLKTNEIMKRAYLDSMKTYERCFCNILYKCTYSEPEPTQKNIGICLTKGYGSTGSGSTTPVYKYTQLCTVDLTNMKKMLNLLS